MSDIFLQILRGVSVLLCSVFFSLPDELSIFLGIWRLLLALSHFYHSLKLKHLLIIQPANSFHNNLSRSRITVSFKDCCFIPLFLVEHFSHRLHLHGRSTVVIESTISDLQSSQSRLCFHFTLRVVYVEASYKLWGWDTSMLSSHHVRGECKDNFWREAFKNSLVSDLSC